MRIKHQSSSGLYRMPTGAARSSSNVRLRLKIDAEGQRILQVRLVYAYGISRFEHSFLPMFLEEDWSQRRADCFWYRGDLRLPNRRSLLFYYFEIHSSDGLSWLVPDAKNPERAPRLVREKPQLRDGEPTSPALWQISIYEENKPPLWLMGAVMYQIFPDRFKRGQDYERERMLRSGTHASAIFHTNWQEEVDFRGRPGEGYLATDFYGGSLQGVTEELDYLHEMGVEVLYLNPVFQARSNHRYDTADYMTVDPLLGTAEDFRELCSEAKKRGIRVILDGVFSHTGADSIYFNKYGHFPGNGAWQMVSEGKESPYASWYHFRKERHALYYDSWWGFPELPSVHELDLSFRDYICGKNGVISHWLREGASGWRLDVSDELPDPFIRAIRKAMKEEKDDAMLMGEIWEDASNKISYGSYRDFILGKTHDCAMGYPFQKALLAWLGGIIPAEELALRLESLRLNYPPTAFFGSMNLISTHDTARAITVLAGDDDPGNREEQAKRFLSAEQRKRGEALLLLASVFQVAYPGVAALYYGDELAQEGYRDPFNRRPFQMEKRGSPFHLRMRQIFTLRKKLPVLRTGKIRMIYAKGDLLVFSRSLSGPERRDAFGRTQNEGPRRVFCLFNRSSGVRCLTLRGRQWEIPAYGAIIESRGADGLLYALNGCFEEETKPAI